VISPAEGATMKAIQIEAYGNPADVVKVVEIPDVGAPAAGEVVIALEASPINQYDLGSCAAIGARLSQVLALTW
jgi:NADPH:quinone reductase-like Zn-dependent oxidoreductase